MKRRIAATVLTGLLLLTSTAAFAHSGEGTSHYMEYNVEKFGYSYYQQGSIACYQVTVNDVYDVLHHYTDNVEVQTDWFWKGTKTYNDFFRFGTCPAN
jgi:hypothetical protein